MTFWSRVLMCLILVVGPVLAQAAVSYAQYETEYASAQQRELASREQIAGEQALIAGLQQQISEVDQRITSVSQEKYAILGVTQQHLVDMTSVLGELARQTSALARLDPNELGSHKDEISNLEREFIQAKNNPASRLRYYSSQIASIESALATLNKNLQVKPSLQASVGKSDRAQVVSHAVQPEQASNETADVESASLGSYTEYRVKSIPGRRETLSRIAGYSEIYGDPYQWPKLYRANKKQIDAQFARYKGESGNNTYANPHDLIYPGQILKVPR